MLVSFTLAEKKLGCWDWATVLCLTLLACVPYVGFAAPIILLIMWFFYEKELRVRIFTFFVVSSVLAIGSYIGFELLISLLSWLWQEIKPMLPADGIFSQFLSNL